MFRGNKQLGNNFDLSRKFENIGGQLNASTSYFFTEYWLDYHIDFFEEGLKHFCDFLKYPHFENIDTERSIILEEVLDDYGYSNQLVNTDCLTADMVWHNKPLGRPVIGRKDSIFSITEELLLNWYKKFYQASNMTIGISGDIDFEKTIALFSKEFEKWGTTQKCPSLPTSSLEETPRRFCSVFHKDSQFNIQWSFALKKMSQELRLIIGVIFRALNDGTGSRLQRTIREEKGLVYDIDTDYLLEQGSCLLSINSTVSENQLLELVSSLVQLIEKFQKEGITEEELQLAKLKFRVGMDYCYDNPSGVLAEKMGKKLLPHYDTGKSALKRLLKITKEDVNQVIKGLFKKGESYFVCVGPGSYELDKTLKLTLKDWI